MTSRVIKTLMNSFLATRNWATTWPMMTIHTQASVLCSPSLVPCHLRIPMVEVDTRGRIAHDNIEYGKECVSVEKSAEHVFSADDDRVEELKPPNYMAYDDSSYTSLCIM